MLTQLIVEICSYRDSFCLWAAIYSNDCLVINYLTSSVIQIGWVDSGIPAVYFVRWAARRARRLRPHPLYALTRESLLLCCPSYYVLF